MRIPITRAEDGMTVKALITARLSPSVRMLKYIKYRPDGITVNGERVTVRRVLRAGDVLCVATADPEPAQGLEPVDLPLSILYEDEDIVVPCKPPEMPTHPSRDHERDTVANALAYRYRGMGIPFVFRPINRLDRNTSGLLLIARNKLAAGRLTRSMHAGEIRKSYLAILEGDGLPDSGEIDLPLRRSAESIIVRETCRPGDPGAEPSRTRYRILARGSGCMLAEAFPLTGRTHQLRVHFAALGYPIAGDDLYGIPNGRIARQALHARSLTFPHPSTRETISLTAPVPEDMTSLAQRIFPGFCLNGKDVSR